MDSNNSHIAALVVGASAGVGRAVAEELARKGYDLVLVARGGRDLESVAQDIALRFHVKANVLEADLAAVEFDGEKFAARVLEISPNTAVAIITSGLAYDDDTLELSAQRYHELVSVNFSSPTQIIKAFARKWKSSGGAILVCSSIAAGVPRSRNMAYSAAKTALESYCHSLQHAAFGSKLSIEILRPGYVDTGMTFGKKLLFPVVSAESVAKIITAALRSPKRLRYAPFYWRFIVMALRSLPWRIYARLGF